MTAPAPRYREIARRLLNCEEAGASGEFASAIQRLFGELNPTLANLVGPVGMRAVQGRALRVARARNPVLERVEVAEGTDGVTERLAELTRQAEPEELERAVTEFLAHLLELLASLLGESVTMRMLRRVQPGLALHDMTLSEGPGETDEEMAGETE